MSVWPKAPGGPTRVPATTLNNLLARQEIARIDFLSIDVEGAEPKVLAGFDIQRFKPRLVCIECFDTRSSLRRTWHGTPANGSKSTDARFRQLDLVRLFRRERRSAVTRPVPE